MDNDDTKDRFIADVRFSSTTPSFKRPSYLYVLPVIFLYFVVVFGLYPLTTQVHIRQVCNDLGEDDCNGSKVSAQASTLNLLASFALSIPSIFACGIYGSIADVYGRKIVMIIPFLGLMFYSAAYLSVDMMDPSSYVAIIIAGNFINGLSGGYFTFIMSGMCYTSDATVLVPHSRKTAYSVTEACIFIPQVFAPAIGGIWVTYFGFFVPLLLAVVISVIAVVYIVFMPESLPPDALSRSLPLKLSPFQTFTSLMFLFTYKFTEPMDEEQPVSPDTPVKTAASPLPILGVAFFIYLMATLGQPAVRILYFTHRFDWDASLIGIYYGLEGLVVSMSMLFAPYVVHRVMQHTTHVKLMTWIQVGYVFK